MLVNKLHTMHIYQNNCGIEKKYCANTFIQIVFFAARPYPTVGSQSVSQSVGQSVSRSVSQSVSRSVGQSVSWSVGQSVSRSISQSVSQPGSQAGNQAGSQPANQSVSQAASQPVSRPASQSVSRVFVTLPLIDTEEIKSHEIQIRRLV